MIVNKNFFYDKHRIKLILNSACILLFFFALGYCIYIWAKHTTVEPEKSVLSNLVADAFILGITLTVINGTLDYRKDKRFRPLRISGIKKIKTEYEKLLTGAFAYLHPFEISETVVSEKGIVSTTSGPAPERKGEIKKQKPPPKINIVQFRKAMYENAIKGLTELDYSTLKTGNVSLFFDSIKKHIDAIDSLVDKYELAFTPEQLTKIMEYQDKAVELSFTSLIFFGLKIDPSRDVSLTDAQQSVVRTKVEKIIELVTQAYKEL